MSIFRLALPGFDVHRNQPENMVLDNLMDSPKIDTTATPPHTGIIFLNWQDTTVIPDTVARTLYSFPHPYKKIPIVVAGYKFDNGFNILKGVLPFQLGALGVITMDADEANINLKFQSLNFLNNPMSVFQMQIRFYVFAEAGY